MIKFIENSETKLKFAVYPVVSLFSYLLILLLFIPLLYWCLYFSPIYASLTCKRAFLNRIDCQLEETSILNSHLTQIDIYNVKKTGRHIFGDRDVRMIIKANPSPPYFHVNLFQTTYFYPSNPFSLVLLRNFNPLNGFNSINEAAKLDNFIRGELHQPTLFLEQKIKGADFLTVGFFLFIPSLFTCTIPIWLLTDFIPDRYEIDLKEKTLSILRQRLLRKNIERKYQLDKIEQIRLDTNHQANFTIGRIILKFDPDYDYPLDEFFNTEKGLSNFQIIKSFLERSKA